MTVLRPTIAQRRYLSRGLGQPGDKLPLFDENGQRVNLDTVRTCISNGWAEPWFTNPLMPDWLVCRLTDRGRALFPAFAVDEDEKEAVA